MLKLICLVALLALVWNCVPYGNIITYAILGLLVLRGLKTIK